MNIWHSAEGTPPRGMMTRKGRVLLGDYLPKGGGRFGGVGGVRVEGVGRRLPGWGYIRQIWYEAIQTINRDCRANGRLFFTIRLLLLWWLDRFIAVPVKFVNPSRLNLTLGRDENKRCRIAVTFCNFVILKVINDLMVLKRSLWRVAFWQILSILCW